MKIDFYAGLRKIAGQKTVDIEMPADTTVGQMIEIVLAHYPEMRERLLDEDGRIGLHAHVIINGRDTPLLEKKLDTILAVDDTISIFPKGHF